MRNELPKGTQWSKVASGWDVGPLTGLGDFRQVSCEERVPRSWQDVDKSGFMRLPDDKHHLPLRHLHQAGRRKEVKTNSLLELFPGTDTMDRFLGACHLSGVLAFGDRENSSNRAGYIHDQDKPAGRCCEPCRQPEVDELQMQKTFCGCASAVSYSGPHCQNRLMQLQLLLIGIDFGAMRAKILFFREIAQLMRRSSLCYVGV